MKICEIMTSPVVSIAPDASLPELDSVLAGRWISGVPVVSPESGELLGIVSKTDVVRRLVDEPDLYQRGVTVWQLMTPDVIWVSSEDTLESVAGKMVEQRVHRVLVYDGEELVGIATSFDFVKAAARGHAP